MTVTQEVVKGRLGQGRLLGHVLASCATFRQNVNQGTAAEALESSIHYGEAIVEFGETPPYALIVGGNRTISKRGTANWSGSGSLAFYLHFLYAKPDTRLEFHDIKAKYENDTGLILDEMTVLVGNAGTEDPFNPGYSYLDIVEIESMGSPTYEEAAESGDIKDPEIGPDPMGVWQEFQVRVRG